MKNVSNRKLTIVLLIMGIVLLTAGGVGVVFIFDVPGFGLAEPSPTPTEVQVVPAAVNTPAPTQSADSGALATPAATVIPTDPFATLNLGKYYVHAASSTGLDNPLIPDRIVIPSIGLDARVVVSDFNSTNVDGETFGQWLAPNELAAGWQPDSALLGRPGNTVIDGHHNEYGEVFGNLVNVKVGDEVYVYSQGKRFAFVIANRMILQELYVSLDTRLNNARWLAPTDDTRLTLVTCWPKLSNTHRLILVARPDDTGDAASNSNGSISG